MQRETQELQVQPAGAASTSGPAHDPADDTINPITVVVAEDPQLRRKGTVKRADLVKEVYVTLDGSRKQAERWVRKAIERGEIDDFPRS